MRRPIRTLLSVVIVALVTTPNAVHLQTASKGADVLGVPSDAALFPLTAKPRQPLLRPDEGPTSLAANAIVACSRTVPAATSAVNRATVAKPTLLRWRTHLPRSQADDPPPSPLGTTLA